MPKKNTKRANPFFLEEWRTHRGLSKSALARAVGTTPSRISEVESGEERYNETLLERLAAALDVESWCLLAGPPESVEPFRPLFNEIFDGDLRAAGAVIAALGAQSKK